VVADRFADSTVAYQGYGRGLPLELVESVNKVATGGVMPDITFLLDVPVETAMERIGKPQLGLEAQGKGALGRPDEAGQSKFEEAGLAFHRRVRSGFLKMVKAEPRRILLMDATKPGDEIAAAVWQIIEQAFAAQEPPAPESKAKPGQSRLI
jgi:dTMP kinase